MGEQSVIRIEAVIDFIENNLDGKLDLSMVASAVHCSKYHVHRLFTNTVGMTIHDYVVRRQLTEAATLLVFSDKPVIEIALACGYESQPAFTVAFKAMYKAPPAEYRERQEFYPLQLPFSLHRNAQAAALSKSRIRLAESTDIPAWMNFVRIVIDGYPHLDEMEYLQKLTNCIARKNALILEDEDVVVCCMAFSDDTGSIDFFGVHPQYRNQGVLELFVERLTEDFLPDREISTTTYREHDAADTGYRDALKRLGFVEKELLVEYGYPTQRFVRVSQTRRL